MIEIHDPYCRHCSDPYSAHGDTEEPHEFPDCNDCGVEAGDDHSPKCSTVKEAYADAVYERMKEER